MSAFQKLRRSDPKQISQGHQKGDVGQHIEVVLCNASGRPVLVHLGKQPVNLCFALLGFFQFGCLFLPRRAAFLIAGVEQPFQKFVLILLGLLAICSCTWRNTSSEIIASWVFSTRYHSSCGLSTFFLFLNEMLLCLLCTL